MGKTTKIILILIVLLIAGVAIYAMTDKNPMDPADNTDEEIMNENNDAAGTQLEGTPMATSTADGQPLVGGDAVVGADVDADLPQNVSFDVIGTNFDYDLKEIRVSEGDTVTINFRSQDGYHDWVVDEFDAATTKVQTGEMTSVTFVAGEAGSYEYYCSVGSHRANGMVGTLIVE
jgi:cytochrome c oxidase subunit 2